MTNHGDDAFVIDDFLRHGRPCFWVALIVFGYEFEGVFFACDFDAAFGVDFVHSQLRTIGKVFTRCRLTARQRTATGDANHRVIRACCAAG